MGKIAKQRPQRRRHTKGSPGKSRVPSLRFHKASGRMYVVLSGRAIYCGQPDERLGGLLKCYYREAA